MIQTFDYLRGLPEREAELIEAIRRVLRSGKLILGPETAAFEAEFAEASGARHCVGTASGTAALHVALAALGIGPGDEVISVANTCVPTVAAIRMTGANPVFVDIDDATLMMDPARIEAAITPRTKAILPVHLWGMSADIGAIAAVAEARGVPIVEDCAQSFGTLCGDRQTGAFGIAGCFSFYPTKNLGAFGDAGAVLTNDSDFADRLRCVRMYGYDASRIAIEEGTNARIGEIQAALLRVQLKRFPAALERRLAIASRLRLEISNLRFEFPAAVAGSRPSYHQFVIRTAARGELQTFLAVHGIGTDIHYPVPVHKMPAYARFAPERGLPITEGACNKILSIPVHENLRDDEISAIIDALNRFSSQ